MGYHHCPIEPDDWANGPNYPEGVGCPDCQGSGELQEVIDGLLRINECLRCSGSGEIEPELYEGDYEWGD